MKLLKCGECGQELHRLYLSPSSEIIAECTNCRTQSIIEITESKIQIRNLNGYGTLCIFNIK